MSAQSLLARLGLRTATLGSAATLAIAAPLAEGNVDPAAQTDATRIGVYFDRTVSAEAFVVNVMGTDRLKSGVLGLDVLTGRLAVPNGTAGAPSVTFTGDTDTGVYHISANRVGIATNGALGFDVSATLTTSTLPVVILSSTASTSPITGSLVTAGGIGALGSVNISGQFNGDNLVIGDAATYVGKFTYGGGSVQLGTYSNRPLDLYTNSVRAGTLNTAGSLDITGGFFAAGNGSAPATGIYAEMGYSSGGATAYVQGFNRTSAVYVPMYMGGSSLSLQVSGTQKVSITSTIYTSYQRSDIDLGTGATSLSTGTLFNYYGADATAVTGRIVTFGNLAGPIITGQNIGGARGAQTLTLDTSGLLTLEGRGFSTTATGVTGSLNLVADGDWSVSNTGTMLQIWGTSNGTTTLTRWAMFRQAQMQSLDGSAAAPFYTFSTSTNMGMYRQGTNALGFSVAGTERLEVNTSNILSTLPYMVGLGSASVPSYTFTGDNNTGIYSSGADTLDFTTGGINRLSISTTQATFSTPVSSILAATQDALTITGRAGGVSSFTATLTPGVLVGNITLTMPLVTGTLMVGAGVANRVAVFNGTNALGNASNGNWSVVATSGAMLETFASSPSVATGSTTIRDTSGMSTGTMGASTSFILSSNALTMAGSALSSSCNFYGLVASVTSDASAVVRYSTSSAYAARLDFTNLHAATTNSTILSEGGGVIVPLSIQSTSGASTQTYSSIYGINIIPGTFSVTSGSTTLITNFYGLRLQALTTSGAGTFTITNRYGVYQDDTAAKNYFGGVTGLGIAPSSTTYANHGIATTGLSSLRLGHGVAPTSPVDGDMWTTTAGLFIQVNGSTVGPLGSSAGGTIGGTAAATRIAFGSGSNTLTSNAAFTYTDAAKFMQNFTQATSGGGAWQSGFFRTTWASSSTSATPMTGLGVQADTTGTGTNTALVQALAISAINNNSAGTLGQLLGFRSDTSGASGSTTTAFYGGYITAVVNAGHTATNAYGLYIFTDYTGTVGAGYGIYQDGTNALNYFTGVMGVGIAPSVTTYLNTGVGTTGLSSLRIGHGAAPTSPVNGDMWTTTAGLFIRINGVTVGPLSAGSGSIGGSITANQVAYGAGVNTIAGSAALTFSGTDLSTTGHFYTGDGTVGAPAHSFTSDTDTGIYRIGANDLGIAAGGTLSLEVSTTAVTSSVIGVFPAATTGAASIRLPPGVAPTSPLNGDMWTTNTGLYVQVNGATQLVGTVGGSIGADQVAFGSGVNTIQGSATFKYLPLTSGITTALAPATVVTGAPTLSVWTDTSSASVSTAAGLNYFALNLAPTCNVGSTGTATFHGIHLAPVWTQAGGSMSVWGMYIDMVSGTATTSAAVGLRINRVQQSSGSQFSGTGIEVAGVAGKSNVGYGINITSISSTSGSQTYGLSVTSISAAGSGTAYGLYLNAITGGTGTTYGVYQNDAGIANFFGSVTGIGIAPATTTYINAGVGTTGVSSLRMGHGAAPTSPVNGDFWTTTAGLFGRINGATVQYGAGSIAGTATAGQVAYGSGSNTITSTSDFTFATGTTGALQVAQRATFALTNNISTATALQSTSNYTGSTNGPGSMVAGQFTSSWNTSGTSADGQCYGIGVTSNSSAGSAVTNLRGINLIASATGSASVTTIIGANLRIQAQSGSAFTTAYGLFVQGDLQAGSTTATYYGLYIDTPTSVGTITTEYGVWQDSATGKNFFRGNTGVGIAPAASTYLNIGPTTTTISSLRLGHGTAPTSPVNGDMWTTTAGLYIRVNGVTVGPLSTGTILGSMNSGQIVFGSGVNTVTGTNDFQLAPTTTGITTNVAPATFSVGATTLSSFTDTSTTSVSTGGSLTYRSASFSPTLTTTSGSGGILEGLYIAPTLNTNVTGSAGSLYGIYVSPVLTQNSGGASSNQWGVFIHIITGAVTGSTSAIGLRINTVDTTTATTQGSSTGIEIAAIHSKSSQVYGINMSGVTNTGGSQAYGFYLNTLTASGSGTAYGLYLNSISGGAGTTFGIYQNDSNIANFLSSVTGIGIAASATTYVNHGVGTTGVSSLRMGHGVAPTSPVDGDFWTTSAGGLFGRINGVTINYGAGGLAGTIAANQVAIGSGTNTIGGSSSLTATTTASALLIAHTAGSSTSDGSGGVFMSDTSATSTAAQAGGGSIFGTRRTTLTITPGGTDGSNTNYMGYENVLVVTSQANTRLGASTIYGQLIKSTFNNAATSGTVLTALYGTAFQPNVIMTQASGTATISAIYGIAVIPNTFSTTSGGTTVISNYYGLYLNGVTTSGSGTTTITNRYGIYQADINALNFFGGNVSVVANTVTSSCLNIAGSTTTVSSMRINEGVAPTSPTNGDFWLTSVAVFARINFATAQLAIVGGALSVVEGSNKTMGVATLSGGTITVNTTAVTANSRIQLTAQSLGTVSVATALAVTARTGGTSFTITSASAVDTSVVAWLIVEPI